MAPAVTATAAGSATAVESFGAGLLGDPSVTSRATPAKVPGLSGVQVVQVSTSSSHTLALGSGGAVYGWGDNSRGEVSGGGTTVTPTRIGIPTGVGRVVQVAAGYQFSMALTSTGRVLTWGSSGQLGSGSAVDVLQPTPIVLPGGVTATAIAAGSSHAAVVTSAGTVLDWGYNGSGQLGDGTTTDSVTPVRADLPASFVPATVSADGNDTFALGRGGRVYAWGFNFYGELGTGTPEFKGGPVGTTPVAVKLPKGVTATALDSAGDAAAVLTSDGRMLTWGNDGSLTFGWTEVAGGPVGWCATPEPVTVPAGTRIVQMSMGSQDAMAVTSTNQVYGWGADKAYGFRPTPATISLPSGSVLFAEAGYPGEYAVLRR